MVEFYNRFLRHYFLTAAQSEIDSIDAGGGGAGWARTGFNFRAFSTKGAPAYSNPVCRFYGLPGLGPNSHFYTAFPSECAYIQSTDPGWLFEGLAFNVVMPDAGICRPGYKPVYRSYNGLAAVNDSDYVTPSTNSSICECCSPAGSRKASSCAPRMTRISRYTCPVARVHIGQRAAAFLSLYLTGSPQYC